MNRTVKLEELKEVAKKMHKVQGDEVKGSPSRNSTGQADELENGAPFSNPDAVTGKGGGATIGNQEDYSSY